MGEPQAARMQMHPLRRRGVIQHVTHDGMANAGHVQPQLVAATGDRFQLHAAPACRVRDRPSASAGSASPRSTAGPLRRPRLRAAPAPPHHTAC
ncbi:hypothetical protein G6F32_015158 [Rhizopus arrhizus]|nr:hypothetical protein G6F32_015158 [Rhizopus arrhizus]